MKYTVTFEFEGENASETAACFFHWAVDGGLDDTILQTMEDFGYPVNGTSCDSEKRTITYATGEWPVAGK